MTINQENRRDMEAIRNQNQFLNEIRRPIRFNGNNRVGQAPNGETSVPINFDPSIFESIEYAPPSRVSRATSMTLKVELY